MLSSMLRHALPPQNCTVLLEIWIPSQYMVPWAHPSPQPKRHLNQFGHFCTAHGRRSLYFTVGAHFPEKLPLTMGRSGRHIIHHYLGPFIPTTQMASVSVQLFLHSSPQSVHILYNGRPFPPSKLPLPMEGSGPPSNTWFLGRVLNPNGISTCSAVFAGLTSVTDRPRCSVCNSRLNLRM